MFVTAWPSEGTHDGAYEWEYWIQGDELMILLKLY